MAALLVPAASNPAASGATPTSLAWELGGGLVTVSTVQNITMSVSSERYCPGPGVPSGICAVPVGITFVPAADVLVVSEIAANFEGTV